MAHSASYSCSPLSEAVTVTTEEAIPGPPENVRVIGATTTQLKIGWDAPHRSNGVLKGYYVYNGAHPSPSSLSCTVQDAQHSENNFYRRQSCGTHERMCLHCDRSPTQLSDDNFRKPQSLFNSATKSVLSLGRNSSLSRRNVLPS